MTPSLPFANLLGIQIIESSPEKVVAELLVRRPVYSARGPAWRRGHGVGRHPRRPRNPAESPPRSSHGDHRKQDQFPSPSSLRHDGPRRMHAHPSRQTNPGLANSHLDPRRPSGRVSHSDAVGALSPNAAGYRTAPRTPVSAPSQSSNAMNASGGNGLAKCRAISEEKPNRG